jgi:transposase
MDRETHKKVFSWILEVLRNRGLIHGKTMGIDATTLQANAAMRSIVRPDTGESYEECPTGLAKESGIETPTREDLARVERTRKNKARNKDWVNRHEPDARIAKWKEESTHLAHKVKHAVDMKTGTALAVTLHGADRSDTATVQETLLQAGEHVAELLVTKAEKAPEEKPQAYFPGAKR